MSPGVLIYIFMNFGWDFYTSLIFLAGYSGLYFIPPVVLFDGEIVRLVQVFVQDVWCVADYICF
jgi:hypothetical protein